MNHRRMQTFVLFGTLVLLPAVLACPQDEDGRVQVADRRECPHDWVWDTIQAHDEQLIVPSGQLSGPGVLQDVPELHDCQRFLVPAKDTLVYDSLYAIFATTEQSKLEILAAFDTVGEELPPELEASMELKGKAVPAAEIYAEGQYFPGGTEFIRRGFSCLYLYRQRGTWRAKLEYLGTSEHEDDCSESVDPGSIVGIDLDVVRTIEPMLGNPTNPAHYQAAARWDWDADAGMYYAGVACPPGWCEVGLPGFTRSPVDHPVPAGASDKAIRTRKVRGWYDEQFLASSAGAGGGDIPTIVRGTIFPHPELADRDDLSEFDGEFVPVAYVALDRESLEYKEKFNFEMTAPGGPYNEISACRGTKEDCLPEAEWDKDECGIWNGELRPWWGRIVAANSKGARYGCIERFPMPADVEVPGAARWRWQADDEGGWFRCVHGCCELRDWP